MSDEARALARIRWAKRDVKKTCPHCGKEFLGVKEQVYCTPSHQQAAAAKRFRDKRRRPAPSTEARESQDGEG